MNSSAPLPGSRRGGLALKWGSAGAVCYLALMVFGGSASAGATTSPVVVETPSTVRITTVHARSVTQLILLNPTALQVPPAARTRMISAAAAEGALPCALAAILLICAGVFVRLFVSIRNSSRRARPEITSPEAADR